ncbi:5710_t:CDS:1, partial [Acaulospora morrowiae]
MNYISVDFCSKNEILLYALPPHTTHILQPAKLPFAKLKNEYSKGCNKLYNDNEELATKHTFAKILGLVFLATYTFTAITNAFRVTEIWSLNPNVIDFDKLEPSLPTEQFKTLPQQMLPIDTMPSSPSTTLSSQPT